MLATRRARLKLRAERAAKDTAVAVDGRLPLLDGGGPLLRKAFPDHWSFLLGELALYSFVVLLITGVYLTLFFDPSMAEVVYEGAYAPLHGNRVSEAYASTLEISFEVRGGLLIRQIHHWAALVMLAAISVHLLRIFFTGAFRRPRELNWVIGVTLLVVTLLEGFAGYSLPDDLLSGTGLRTTQGFILSVPIAGTYLSMFVFGGEFPGAEIIPRLYTAHILLLPGLLLAAVTVHLMLVFHLKHTQWRGPGKTNANAVGKPMFPQFTAKTLGLLAMVFGVLALLGGLAQINPVWAYGPYQPDVVSTGAQPDWYLGFIEGGMRLMPGFETRQWGHTIQWNPLIPAVVFPGVFFGALYAYPFLERWITAERGEQHVCDRPRERPVRTALGVAGVVFYALLLIAGGQDLIARTFDISVNGLTWNLRFLVVLAPVAAFWLTKRVCLALIAHDAERLTLGDETGDLRQSPEGGFGEEHRPPEAEERYILRHRATPSPLPARRDADQPETRLTRMRRALSIWFHQPGPVDAAARAPEDQEGREGQQEQRRTKA